MGIATVVILATILGVWMVFDGLRAFVVGDYVTSRTGAHAGRLGPWASIVRAVGLEPRSNLVRGLHVILGGCWLAAVAAVIIKGAQFSWLLLICAGMSLWYAPVGTVISLIVFAVLLGFPVN